MIKLKIQYPFIDDNGKEFPNLIKTFAIDEETNIKYNIHKIGTDEKYGEAIDIAESYLDFDGTTKYKPKYFEYEITYEVIEEN